MRETTALQTLHITHTFPSQSCSDRQIQNCQVPQQPSSSFLSHVCCRTQPWGCFVCVGNHRPLCSSCARWQPRPQNPPCLLTGRKTGLPDKVLLSPGDTMRVRCDSQRDCKYLCVLLWVPGWCSTVLTAGTSAESKQSPQMTWRQTNKTHSESLVYSIEESVQENQMGNPKSFFIAVLQMKMWFWSLMSPFSFVQRCLVV